MIQNLYRTLGCLSQARQTLARVLICAMLTTRMVPGFSAEPLQKVSTPAPRHALVIGNSSYSEAPLANPKNDALAIAERLRLAGFSVNLKLDVGRRELQQALRDYATALTKDQGIGVFYYAGHGVQLNWRNFLIPVDASIFSKADIGAQAVDLGLLMEGLTRARSPLSLIILDACRNNPFGPDFRTEFPGLSQLDAPPGTLLAYATAPGNTAADGEGSHGLYTNQLLREMMAPGATVEDVFKRVRLSVRKTSQGAQIPWESTSLEADFVFFPGQNARDMEREFEADLAQWNRLRLNGTTNQLETFIHQRPNGKFAEMAQFRLDQILLAQGQRAVVPRVASEPCQCAGAGTARGTVIASSHAANAQAFKVGERYAYRNFDLLTRKEIASSASTVMRIQGDEVHFSDGRITDLFGNNVRAPDGRKWTPYQFFIAEYKLGKRWPAQFLVTQPNGKTLNNDFLLRVAERERITLPAGTFDALRIEARGTDLGNGDLLERTAWVAPELMRGVLAMEALVRRDGKVIRGERSELSVYATNDPVATPVPAALTPARKAVASPY